MKSAVIITTILFLNYVCMKWFDRKKYEGMIERIQARSDEVIDAIERVEQKKREDINYGNGRSENEFDDY